MLAAFLIATLAQSIDLTKPPIVSRPGGPSIACFGPDGDHVFQAQGPSMAVLGFGLAEQCAFNPAAHDAIAPSALIVEASAAMTADMSPMSVVAYTDEEAYVAGGDWGLFKLVGAQGSRQLVAIDGATSSVANGRWCTGVAISEDGMYLAATFGAHDASELRVYLRNAPPPTGTFGTGAGFQTWSIPLTSATILDPNTTGTPPAGLAYDVAVQGSAAYVAMGNCGVVKIGSYKNSTASWSRRRALEPTPFRASVANASWDPSTLTLTFAAPLSGYVWAPGDVFVVRDASNAIVSAHLVAAGSTTQIQLSTSLSSTASSDVDGELNDAAYLATQRQCREVIVLRSASEHPWLYAASDDKGVLAVDLSATWPQTAPAALWPMCTTTSGSVPTGYAAHIAGVRVPTTTGERDVVTVACYPTPVREEEWGPFRPYSSFDWDSGSPFHAIFATPAAAGFTLGVFDHTLASGARAYLVSPPGERNKVFNSAGDEADTSWYSIDAIYRPGIDLGEVQTMDTVWVADQSLRLWGFYYVSGVLTDHHLVHPGKDWVERYPSFATGYVTGTNSNLVLYGRDGDAKQSLMWFDQVGSTPTFSEIAGTLAGPSPSFLDPTNSVSFSLMLGGAKWAGTGGLEYAFNASMRTWRYDATSSASTFASGWRKTAPDYSASPYNVPLPAVFPPDPWQNQPGGSQKIGSKTSYSFTLLDPRAGTDIAYITRGSAPHGLIALRRSDLQSQIDAQSTAPIATYNHFLTHGEWSDSTDFWNYVGTQSVNTEALKGVHTLVPTWHTTRDGTPMLIVAGGYVARRNDTQHEHGRVKLFDMSSYTSVSGSGTASVPTYTWTNPNAQSFEWGVALAKLGSSPRHTFLLMMEFNGRIIAKDITTDSDVQNIQSSTTAGTWTIADNAFDLRKDSLVDLRVDSGYTSTNPNEGWLYVAASRRGWLRLRLLYDPLTGALAIGGPNSGDEVYMNTPGQAGGFAFRPSSVTGKRGLFVADHEQMGLRFYGDF